MIVDGRQFRAVLEYFYGRGVGRYLPWKRLTFSRSKKTHRLKKVWLEGKLMATIREDGSVAYTLECAKYLMRSKEFRKNCVLVNDDAARFVAEGRSLFAKHVVAVGPNVKVGLDVPLLDKEGRLLAVGRAMLPRRHMSSFKSGVAVRVREGAGHAYKCSAT